jgi:3-dehydroquinate dehydratase-1
MFKKPMICAVIFKKDSDSVLTSAEKAINMGADMLEFRIDRLEDPKPENVQRLAEAIDHPLIVTNRMMDEGGYFTGSEKERTNILIKAAEYADFVDIELNTEEKYRSKVIEASKSVIVSYHNFEKTPSFKELVEIVKLEKEIGDIAKFAVMPKKIGDTLTVLKVLAENQNTIGFSMNDLGKYTRIVAPIFGSPITYASIDMESAPGQLDILTIKEILSKLTVID